MICRELRKEFEWWNGLWEPSIYAAFKQICLGTGNDLATVVADKTWNAVKSTVTALYFRYLFQFTSVWHQNW